MENLYCINCGTNNEIEKGSEQIKCSKCNNIVYSPQYKDSGVLFFSLFLFYYFYWEDLSGVGFICIIILIQG